MLGLNVPSESTDEPERKWSGLDLFIFALRTLWFAASMALLMQKELNSLPDVQMLVWFLLSYMVPQFFFRPGLIRPIWYVTLEMIITGSLLIYTSTLDGGGSIFKFLYLPLSVGYLTGRKGLWTVGPVVVLMFPLLSIWYGDGGLSAGQIFDFLAYYIAFYGLGYALQLLASANRRTVELVTVIKEKNEVLEQYSRQVENMTLLTERSRLARELHDTVGHTFTSVIIGMDALGYLIDSSPEEAKANLRELLVVTRQGLDETRKAIHQMGADDSDNLVASITRIADEFAHHTGTAIEVKHKGAVTELPLSQAARLTLLRCLQESLTNAKKHGGATGIMVTLENTGERLRLTIADNGTGAKQLIPGFGLNAMRERLSVLHGTLETVSQPGPAGGTTIICSLPIGRERAYEE